MGTFLTQVGVEHYDGLEKYTVSGTSQSTVLLQKKKKMQEVQAELDRKKHEYQLRMRKCKEKEAELSAKQEKIRDSVIKFEVFVKENDAKRTRALKKERAEVSSRKQKEQEIVGLQSHLHDHSTARHKSLRMVEKLAVFEAYLEAVVETSQEFDEVGSLLKRHETLTLTNRDLRGIVDNGNQAIEHTRAELTQVSKEKANEILVATSDIASHQKRSEQLRSDNSQLEAELQYRDNAFNQRKRTLGECEMAIRNIYLRSKKGNVPHEDMHDFGRLLEYVQNRMLDLSSIFRMQKEANEWTSIYTKRAAHS